MHVVKILVGDNGLVGVVKTDKDFVDGSVEYDIYNGAEEFRLRMVCIFFFFRTQVQFFRTKGIGIAANVEEITFPDEAGHEGVLRVMVDAVGIPVLLDDPVVHNDDAVAHGEGFFLVVGNEDEGEAQAPLQVLQFQLQFFPELVVQGPQRFVQKQHFGAVYQGPGNGYPLLLAAGHLGGIPVPQLFQLGQVQHLVDALLCLVVGHSLHLQPEMDILRYGHMGEQGIVLEYHVDIAFIRRQIGNILAVQDDPAGSRRFQTGDHAQQCGFAAAGGPQQRNEFTVVDSKVQ